MKHRESRKQARPPRSREELLSQLARERTLLANERTLLAYVRTAMASFILGVSLLKFFGDPLADALGWAFIVLTPAILAAGAWRFRRINALVDELERRDLEDRAE